jgi:hypothetical protein
MHRGFVGKKKKGRSNLKDVGVDGKIMKWILQKEDRRVWNGLIWLKTGTSGRLL